MANTVYNIARQLITLGQLDLSSANLWILLTLGYSPAIESHEYVDDISSSETTGDGYTRQKLQNVTLTKDTVNNRMVLTGDNMSWAYANFQASGAVLYVNSGLDSSSPLITFLDFGGIKQSQNTPFIISWSTAEGILNLR